MKYLRTWINQCLEHDSFVFTMYYYPWMCRFLLFCYEIKWSLQHLAITWKCRFLVFCCKIWLSHSLKMGFIAVEVTEVSFFNHHYKNRLNFTLFVTWHRNSFKPSLIDAHQLALSYEIKIFKIRELYVITCISGYKWLSSLSAFHGTCHFCDTCQLRPPNNRDNSQISQQNNKNLHSKIPQLSKRKCFSYE